LKVLIVFLTPFGSLRRYTCFEKNKNRV
jgi:hypothetical protein